MRMAMHERCVFVPMDVRLAARIVSAMPVPVVFVVPVSVRMRHRLVTMLVLVLLGEVQPHADRHEQGGDT